MLKVLFLRGLPDTNEVHAEMHDGELACVINGCSNVIHAMQPARLSCAELLLIGRGPKQRLRYSQTPDVIFNEISEPDTHDIALGRAEQFIARMPQVPLVNPPTLIRRTTREQVCEALQGRPGLIIPRTIRCRLTAPDQVKNLASAHNIGFPLLVRVAGAHGGKSVVKIESATDVQPLHALPLDGRDFYVTEFVDYRSEDGLYRKYRIAVVLGKPLPRHVRTRDNWLVNIESREFMDENEALINEQNEMDHFRDEILPNVQPALDEIYQAIQLDYFGVDCHVTKKQELIVFEVNANMNILILNRRKDIFQPYVDRIGLAVESLIRSKVM